MGHKSLVTTPETKHVIQFRCPGCGIGPLACSLRVAETNRRRKLARLPMKWIDHWVCAEPIPRFTCMASVECWLPSRARWRPFTSSI